MSERILRALMQLFAIVAKVDDIQDENDEIAVIQSTHGKEIIEGFLKSELSSSDVKKYLNIFDEFLNTTRGKLYSKSGDRKRTSLHSVKILRICEQINTELTQRQKFIVLVRIFEFMHFDDVVSEQEMDFIRTVADSFNINNEEFLQIHRFIDGTNEDIVDEENHVYYCNNTDTSFKNAKLSVASGIEGFIHAIYIVSVRTIFFRYFGKDELFINGQIADSEKTHVFNIGSTIRTTKSAQIYYSDLISKVKAQRDSQPICFQANNIGHAFKEGQVALRTLSFTASEGNLVGIMGGSGTGKTTLLNVMNGKMKPTEGELIINGINLHEDPKSLEGVIGYVSQSDLLIEELTVFDNLFYGARLCMKGYTDAALTKRVVEVLKMLGLFEIHKLKVGSTLDKVISGGQRKRLNIALELIRQPAILFVDEPTSGLSSRDSENIMDLLKELALKGKLVFVVIHQPSSNIFKLFDRLLIMDKGGFPIYDGNPLNAIVHFKTFSYRGNAHERECSLCGNVNPEQIFDLIDARIVDEFGNETTARKKSPQDWHKLHLENLQEYPLREYEAPIKASTTLPSKLRQFWTYVVRDVLSKASNLQYVIVNVLIAPILALVLSFFIKYFDRVEGELNYSYFDNENIPQYIFISVIVAIFLGLTVSAEEINRDKQILSREKYLNVSRNSYLFSKILILFTLSAVQTILFVWIGNSILEIEGMWFQYWLILFSTACASNLLGLNISSAFNSAKVIYIIVPLLIIPQLLFSGVIVKFDKLHPSLSDATKVPWIGNVMVSRWAYEAIAVEQGSNNSLAQKTFEFDVLKSEAKWKQDYWLPEMRSRIQILQEQDKYDSRKVENARQLLINEISKESALIVNLPCKNCITDLKTKPMKTEADFNAINAYLNSLKIHWSVRIAKNNSQIDNFIRETGQSKYMDLKKRNMNEALGNLLTNRTETQKVIVANNEIFQNDDPIYNDPLGTPFFQTHFYAPSKYLFGRKYTTFQVNLIIIWSIAILTYIALYFDVVRHFLVLSMRIFNRVRDKVTKKTAT